MHSQLSPRLILEDSSLVGRPQEIALTGQEIVIGRDALADLVIASPLVSRRHVRLYPDDGRYTIEDLGSTNKTYVNGQLLDGPRRLSPGDSIRIGTAVHLTFDAPPADDVTEVAAVAKTAVDAVLPGVGQTMLAQDQPPLELARPPLLVVSVGDGEPRSIPLVHDRTTLGRAPDNHIVLSSPIVSAHHATLERGEQGTVLRIQPNVTNPIYCNGSPVPGEQVLHDGDVLRIGSQDPGAIVSLAYQWPAEAALRKMTRHVVFGANDRLHIGRDPDNDVVLDAPIISRMHALVERIGQRFRVRDLNSANGTFVNDQRIDAETWLKPGDTIRIGPYRFVLGEDQLARFDETGGLRVEVLGLNKWVRKDLNLLKDISLVFQPRDFVVIVGQSGGGKSTLVDAIAGYRPATHGRVLVNGIDIYRHFDAIRNEIGFVPQRDIIHAELTVYQALDYAAQLRMPADTSPAERRRRVLEVLEDLDLVHRQDVQISGLSGGQQKRVSIGVELLTKPGLFFLDEPTSGLDPGAETSLMHLMRRLADQGRTIILITHATKNVMLADRVLFLARGGYVAWFGPPDEALRYFDRYRSERERRTKEMEFDAIYAILDDPAQGKAEDWAKRYRESPAYEQYIAQPLAPVAPSLSPSETAPVPRPARRVSSLRQFRILSSRNVRSLTRDRVSLILMLAAAPIVASLDVVLSFILGRDPLSYAEGDMGNAMITLFQPGMLAILVGALAMMREFVKEGEIFKRERLVNLRVVPYVMSKLWVAALLALFQAVVYVGIHYLAFEMPGGVLEFALIYVTVFLATLAGMALGLLASAIAPNANAAPLIVILLIIPQIVLGGGLIPMPPAATAPSSARWAFEALISITGAGSGVAADPCWQLDEEVRDGLSSADKEARGCPCMGLNVLDPDSCAFPGLGSFRDAALEQAEPVAPASIAAPPAQPVLPPRPAPPADQADTQAMAQFLQELDAYQQQADKLQADYQLQIAAYRADSEAYQTALAEWSIKRNTAVSRAEGLMKRFQDDFGWAFVDKEDDQAYWSKLMFAWGAQAAIIVALFVVILVAIARKS